VNRFALALAVGLLTLGWGCGTSSTPVTSRTSPSPPPQTATPDQRFDAKNLTPLFPFGFGLSYTTFSFSNAQLAMNLSSSNPNFRVRFRLRNAASVAGAEVAQVYLGLPAATDEPLKRLVGWQKVLLRPGQIQNVTIEVDENDSSHPLSYWDVNSNNWQVANGDYSVYLGNSSRNVTLVGTFHVGP
jgi:beta-glucosidase